MMTNKCVLAFRRRRRRKLRKITQYYRGTRHTTTHPPRIPPARRVPNTQVFSYARGRKRAVLNQRDYLVYGRYLVWQALYSLLVLKERPRWKPVIIVIGSRGGRSWLDSFSRRQIVARYRAIGLRYRLLHRSFVTLAIPHPLDLYPSQLLAWKRGTRFEWKLIGSIGLFFPIVTIAFLALG